MRSTACRLCASTDLVPVIDLGHHPLADTFLPSAALNEAEVRYPLRVVLCRPCGYVMSEYVVPPDERYQKNEYSYDSSNSPVAERHFKELADTIAYHTDFSAGGLAVDIGSNVGTLLGYLKSHGAEPFGIEPSRNIADIAIRNGIPTVHDFLSDAAVKTIKEQGVPVRSISATNVFNHLEDVRGALGHMRSLLARGGIVAIEVPYLLTLIERTAFDTVYLEHVSYFSLEPHLPVFAEFGLYPYAIEVNDYMGGSIRLILGDDPKRVDQAVVESFLARESACGTRSPATYASFMERAQTLKHRLLLDLAELRRDGKRIAGLGAATKGNTLLNYCGIDRDLLEYVLETSVLKIGKYTPGSYLPIIAEADLGADVSHLLILPWNIGDYLKQKLAHLPVEFIIPRV